MDETRRVGWALLVLLTTLLLVYVIFFDMHESGVGQVQSSSTEQVNQKSSSTNGSVNGVTVQETLAQEAPGTTYESILSSPASQVYDRGMQAKTQLTNASISPGGIESNANGAVAIPNRDTRVITSIQNNTGQRTSGSAVRSPVAAVKLPEVIEDLDGKTFFSTDYLFGRQDTRGEIENVDAENQNIDETKEEVPYVGIENEEPKSDLSRIRIQGTRERDGTLEIIDKLNLEDDVQYTLKNIHNTHFIYLGQFTDSLTDIVKFLGGTLVDITDQITIQNSHLFGAKVTKITVPSYKNNLKELMVVTFANGDSRFLQIDKDYYNILENKIYIKQLFEEHY